MDITLSVSRNINAPPPRVFERTLQQVQFLATAVPPVGPLPGVVKVEVEGDRLCLGAIRRVYLSNGAILEEPITEYRPPNRLHYDQPSDFGFPINLLAVAGCGWYHLDETTEGTKMSWGTTITLTSPWVYPLAWLLMNIFLRLTFWVFLKRAQKESERE